MNPIDAPKLQIWNNATFDDKDSAIESTWSNNLPPEFINNSFSSDGSKENHIPKQPVTKAKSVTNLDIDKEIEEVETKISRLSTRLESLRLVKAEQLARSIAIKGRIIPAKFMDSQKPTVKFDDSSIKPKTIRRGVSLGPSEISSSTGTPMNRRKSCFFKLPGIEEGKVGKTSLGQSPITKPKKAVSTGGLLKKSVKKEEGVLLSIQPKRLFKEEVVKKPLKPGRVVASRYSMISKDVRKRSLENEEKENKRSEKRRASDENCKSEGRVKKRWEIPSEVDGVNNEKKMMTPIGQKLPKIRTFRGGGLGESPRDSGAAKRVAELESKNRNFTFCQLLRFEE